MNDEYYLVFLDGDHRLPIRDAQTLGYMYGITHGAEHWDHCAVLIMQDDRDAAEFAANWADGVYFRVSRDGTVTKAAGWLGLNHYGRCVLRNKEFALEGGTWFVHNNHYYSLEEDD